MWCGPSHIRREDPAVDRGLERRGMLRRLTRAEQIAELTPRRTRPRTPEKLRDSGRHPAAVLVREIVAAGRVSHLAAAA
jgi:hypothetical protein